jgi:hypothetical protein
MYFKTFKMSKKMNTPEKKPPESTSASLSNGNANAPTTQVPETTTESMLSSSNAPKLNPPEKLTEGVTAFGAAVWSTDKRVNGLYTTYNAHNSWMSIAGIGWKKLATGSDSMCEAMTNLAAHAREKNCRIDFSEENGLIKEIYVW